MKFPCPQCHHALEICRSLIGFSVRCPSCQHPVAVPKESLPVSPSDPQPAGPVPSAEPDSAPVTAKRSPKPLGITVTIAAAIVLGGIGLFIKNTKPATPAAPSPAEHQTPPPAPTPSPAETAQSK